MIVRVNHRQQLSLNKKMELGNPVFMRVFGLFLCGLSTDASITVFPIEIEYTKSFFQE